MRILIAEDSTLFREGLARLLVKGRPRNCGIGR